MCVGPDIEDGVTLLEYETIPLAELFEPTLSNPRCRRIRSVVSSPLFFIISLIFCLLIVGLIFGIMTFKYATV